MPADASGIRKPNRCREGHQRVRIQGNSTNLFVRACQVPVEPRQQLLSDRQAVPARAQNGVQTAVRHLRLIASECVKREQNTTRKHPKLLASTKYKGTRACAPAALTTRGPSITFNKGEQRSRQARLRLKAGRTDSHLRGGERPAKQVVLRPLQQVAQAGALVRPPHRRRQRCAQSTKHRSTQNERSFPRRKVVRGHGRTTSNKWRGKRRQSWDTTPSNLLKRRQIRGR